DTGRALFAYRVALTDAALEILAAQSPLGSASGSVANP
ncbi:MAG: NUDIX hydrolase, partial [Chloroflexi bacterium]|nr:NUDIX hydrolase [Chloroflexota bacterium]